MSSAPASQRSGFESHSCLNFSGLPHHCMFCFQYQVFYKLLDILKFDNIVKLSTCILAQKIFNKSSHITRTRYASKGNFHRPKVRTNTGKFTFVYVASKLWETVPTNLKWLSISNFKKRYKDRLLKCQP